MSWLSTIGTRVRDTWNYREEPESYAALAEHFWRALLFLATLIIIGVISYGSLTFFSALKSEEDAAALTEGRAAALDREALRATLDGFALRKAQYDLIKATPLQIPDPSK